MFEHGNVLFYKKKKDFFSFLNPFKKNKYYTVINFDNQENPIQNTREKINYSIIFDSYLKNQILPQTIFKHNGMKEYRLFLENSDFEQHIKKLNFEFTNYNPENLESSKYNCMYNEIINKNNLIFCITKTKTEQKFIFSYNPTYLDQNDMIAIIKYIFTKEY